MSRNDGRVLVIPAPAEWINANARIHHMERARRTGAWRNAAAAHALADRLPVFTRCTIAATPRPVGARVRDAANLYPTIKACIDGLRDAAVLEDDHDGIVASLTIYPCDPVPRMRGRLAVGQLVLTITAVA
jgi:hypothetical protein